ncbi:eukaryotic translation initiation factor 5 [Tilletia horrida]|nr:eukaryotic translation initiation factor 5 [Tilletia horrida]
MATVNVRRDVQDKFYRYKMPLLQTKIEGKGNGIKTVIANMSDIARALSRPPTYPTKYFGYELGALTKFEEKADRYIVNGAHDANRLRELLDTFIDKFVLCGDCKNPETDLKITKDGSILRDCKACGKRTDVDMRHKLVTFITNNPPPKKAKGQKGAGKAAGQSVDVDGPAGMDGEGTGEGGSDDELTKRIESEAKDIPSAEAISKKSGGDDEWSVDTSEAAVKARVKALEGSMQSSLIIGADDDEEGEDENSPYAQFAAWCTANRKGGEEASDKENGCTAVEVFKKAQELGIEKKHRTCQIVMASLFTEDAVKEVDRYAPVLLKLTTSEKHQKALLGGLEQLAAVSAPSLVPNGVPKLLMALYQIDVLDDEEMLKTWGTHVSKKYVEKEQSKKVRRAAAPFLEWLDQAEEDDDDDDDDEDDDEDLDDI